MACAPTSSRFVLVALLVAAISAPLAAAAGPWVENEQARVRLVSRWAAAAPGGDAGLGLEYRLAPGWHVYWLNPGDAGYPPKFTLTAGPLDALTLQYPAPHRFDLPGGLVSYGYADEVVYPLAATLATDAAASPAAIAAIAAEIDYLVCAEQCIPYRAALTLALPTAAAAVEDAETAPAVDRWRQRLPRPLDELAGGGARAELRRAAGPELDLELAVAADGLSAATPELFFAVHPLLVIERPAPRAGDAAAAWSVHLRPIDETQPLPERLTFAWTATGLELAGESLAVAGTLDLARPASAAAAGAPLRWLAPLAVLALAAFFIYRRWRTARPTPTT